MLFCIGVDKCLWGGFGIVGWLSMDNVEEFRLFYIIIVREGVI